MPTIAETLALALGKHRAGDLAKAASIYRQILHAEPHHVGVWHLLGTICQTLDRPAEAVRCFQQAVHLAPDHFDSHHNLGQLFLALGKFDEASAAWRQYLRFRPDAVEAYQNLAAALRGQGKHEEALAVLQQALRLDPKSATTYHRLGSVLTALNRLDEAIANYEQALRLDPSLAEAHNDLGTLLQRRGKLDEAASCYEQAVHLRPDFAEAHMNLGIARQVQGRLDEAAASYRQVLRLKPGHAVAHNNLGLINIAQERFAEAEACCRQAVLLSPDYALGYNGLGLALSLQRRLEEAMASLQQALRIKPDFAVAHVNLGLVFRELGRLNEALASFEQAAWLEPQNADAHLGRATVQLLLGNFEDGLPGYEWRLKLKHNVLPPFSQPYWDGSPLAGRTTLLHQQWGLGDTLQFIRYAPLVKRRGGRVLVTCEESLIPLLASCPGIDELVVLGSPLPAFDVYVTTVSLPFLCRTSLATIPAEVPYLHADAGLVEQWRRQLGPMKAFKIGIAWHGSSESARRSVRLAQFAPLGQVPGVRLFSLQKGPGMEQLAEVAGRFQVTDLGSQFRDFGDTAAVLKNLDLVVTIDSVVAHCAGALGVPVWVALLAHADWRWLLEREDSPWYPTMRLFRQKRQGDWDEVFQRIAAEVKRKVSGRGLDGF